MDHLQEKTVGEIIDLAKSCYPPQEKANIDSGINPFSDKEAVIRAFKPNPELKNLQTAINNLSDDEKAEIMALMWIGRRNEDKSKWEDLLGHAKNEISDADLYLASKAPLAFYLERGLKIVKGS